MKRTVKLCVLTLTTCLTLLSCKESITENKNVNTTTGQSVKGSITVIDVTTFENAIATPGVQLIDVRKDYEWDRGHLENAKRFELNNPNWQTQIETLDKDKPVYVYCEKGGRSARSAKQLKKAGFTKVYDLEGGIRAWKAAGKSVEVK